MQTGDNRNSPKKECEFIYLRVVVVKRIKTGFTLIELLVVIAIIAILAAILFPVFVGAKAKSQQVNCSNNLRQITIALLQYADDWQGYLPGLNVFGDLTDASSSTKSNKGPLWKYIKTRNVFICPVDYIRRREKDPTKRFNFTYTINGYMTIAETDRNAANYVGVSLSKSKNARRTVLVIDENCDPLKGESVVNDALFIWHDRTADRHPGSSAHVEYINNQKVIVTGVATVCYLDSHTGILPGLYEWDEHPEIFKR